MDHPSHPVFIRQTSSKAIPIINPDSGQRRPVLIAHKLASTFPASLHPTTKGLTPTPSTPINTKTPPRRTLKENSVSEVNGQAFNVYARPFVPEALTIINTLHGQEIGTPGTNQIDFDAYVRKYIGREFLPPIPPPVELPMNASFSLTDNFIHTHYEQYFRYHLEAEIKSQQLENEAYSLYGHDVTILSHEPGQPATCSFLVPGLQENSPYVEEDDTIQLRQLRYDHMGRILRMEEWLTPSSQFAGNAPGFSALSGRWRGEPAPGWTGVVYNARALSVQRKKETLFIRVCGPMGNHVAFDLQHSLPGQNHLKFNVQFPVPIGRYLPMRHALPIIQEALKAGIGNLHQNQYQEAYRATNVAHAIVPESRQYWLQSMLFPTEVNCEVQTELNGGSFNRPFFDDRLNWEQQKAIESICSHNYGTLPFLVSGPPGTGKTKTLVETALQLIHNVNDVSHILFCAPSDPAADTLIQRLSVHLKPSELLRLNRPSRTFAEVSDTVLSFCYILQNTFDLPPFRDLMSYRIVVTTCRDASILMYSRMTNADLYAAEYGLSSSIHPYGAPPSPIDLHWTALLIDEAAQAMEPEVLIPLSVVAPPLGSGKHAFMPLFAMAGDEHQLGPRTSLRSSPLKTSLFARLFARPVYASHPLARSTTGRAPPALSRAMLPILRPAFANLMRNYRSHPAILAVPSSLFYADTLEPEAADTDRLASWAGWQGKRWPVLFHSNTSEDELEQDGGGWYNIGEAQIACQYAAHLVQSGLVEQKEVCIMSPFKAQVQRLRKMIRDQKYGSLWAVDIGPTEAFQGLERGVVILCITRSKQQFLSSDKDLDWGIIDMPNKMNVALTRAKFGLIVIGKKEMLLTDPNWKAFLDFSERNGLVTGKTDNIGKRHISDQPELTRLEKMLLAKEQDLNRSQVSGARVLGGTSQEDEMWTSGMHAALNMGSFDGSDYDDREENE